jgi:light-regulated signal transduction histidine kinase (bacteriophytochrome)
MMQGHAKALSGVDTPTAIGVNRWAEGVNRREADANHWNETECVVELNADSLHDLVGPANQMRTMAELILKRNRARLDKETEDLFGFLETASDNLDKLLTGLRTYMHVMGGQASLRRFDANAALAGAIATVQESIDRVGARLTCDPLPEIYGDPNQISYAFASLLENSIKFGGERSPEIHIAGAEIENGWEFCVRDTGIGIDPRQHDKIFGVFKRVHKDEFPGAGMGLAIAKRVVERHGGRIWVESRLGEGAAFFFTLAAADR